MSKLTIKNRTVQESGEPASFGKAYREFLNRCWRDTPNGVKPNYSEQAINFMLDCAHIANGTSVKGLPQQGYTLTVANIGNLVGDCLHLCYEKNDGDTSIDIWLNPHTQFVNVDMMGITDPEKVYHVDFNARKNTADDFADFIENLPNYTGKSKTAESRKMTIRVHEASNVASWDDMAELFQELGYFPADDCPAEDLCAYDEMDTGLDAPEKVTIVAYYRPSGDFYVTVAACSYDRGCREGHVGDMFYTFIDAENEHVTVESARAMLKDAEKARNNYIKALKGLRR